MKKVYLLGSLLMVAVLCFATMAWAEQISFFDEAIGKIIVVQENIEQTEIKIKVLSTTNIVDTHFSAECPLGNPLGNPAIIYSGTILAIDTSLAYDSKTGTAYVFYNDGTPEMVICSIVSNSISGTVTYNGSPLANVTVSLTGTASGTTVTDSDGKYIFAGLENGPYTVTPSKNGYYFTPSFQDVTISNNSATGSDFVGYVLTHSISGIVTDGGGGGLAGVTVTLTGAASKFTTTGGDGSYSFTGLSNGSYTVTPSLTGYAFSPSSQSVTISGSDASGINFTAQAGLPDLIILSLSVPSTIANNLPFLVSVTVYNQGNAPAGPFTVKAYFSSGNKLLCTWNISGLAAGATTSISCSATISGVAIHLWYNVTAVADADNQVVESNETNNSRSSSLSVNK